MKTSYVFLAEGFEEIEALATVDIMRRAQLPVTTVAITSKRQVRAAHGVTVEADATIDEVDLKQAQWLILPGGMPGATNLAACKPLCEALKARNREGGLIAAICASPAVVLAPLGILDGRKAVCYPGMESSDDVFWGRELVATDGNVVTGAGPAAAAPFALTIVRLTSGDDVAREVAEGMLIEP